MNQRFWIIQASARLRCAPVLIALLLAGNSWGTQDYYINSGSIVSPPQPVPQIDATNFVNQGNFLVDLSFVFGAGPFQFSETRNFTNRNVMTGYPGFDFQTLPVSAGVPRQARSFMNGNLVGPYSSATVYGSQYLNIWATNVINRGVLQTGDRGLLSIQGSSVDLAGSGLVVDGFSGVDGIYSDFWAISNGVRAALTPVDISIPIPGTNTLAPLYMPLDFAKNSPVSLPMQVTSRPSLLTGYVRSPFSMAFTNPIARQWVTPPALAVSNFMAQVLFINTNNNNAPGILPPEFANYGFDPVARKFGTIAVGWAMPYTNVFGVVVTNYITLTDDLATQQSNSLKASFSGLGGLQTSPTYQPTNFTVLRVAPTLLGFSNILSAAYTTNRILSGTNLAVTNFFSAAYRATLTSTNVTPEQGPLQTYATTPGRIELVADDLNLNNTRIESLGFVSIRAKRHFISHTNAAISTPFCDIHLASTNDTLKLADLLRPSVPRLVGTVDIVSTVWSNSVYLPLYTVRVDTNTFAPTNVFNGVFNVVMVDSHLTNSVSTIIQNLSLTCTNVGNLGNVYIGGTNQDVPETFNVLQSFSVNAPNLTLQAGAVFNLLCTNPIPDWEAQAPNLQTFTNYGLLTAPEGPGLFFMKHSPAFTTVPYPPYPRYKSFVNHGGSEEYFQGGIYGSGIVIAADYCENDGLLSSASGPISIYAGTAQLSDGTLAAPQSDISIDCNNLLVTNANLMVGRALTLSVTNTLAAGFNTVWSVSDGFNLLVKPATGDLLDTEVACSAYDYAHVVNNWAGVDRGRNLTGYTNNVAIADLTLNGGVNSYIHFAGVSAANAIYVTDLHLLGSLENLDANTNVLNLIIEPGMKIYYQSADVGGVDMSAELDGKNQGRLLWVDAGSDFFYSTLRAGFKRTGAKVSAFVPAAINAASFTAGNVALDVTTGSAANTVVLSWNTPPNATSLVYAKPVGGDNWFLLTTHVSSSQTGGRVSVQDTAGATGLLYKVEIIPSGN